MNRARVATAPRALVKLGTLEEVTYRTAKGDEGIADYVHQFGEEGGKKPILTMTPNGKQLHIVGGSYRVTQRGIEN